MVEAAAPHRPRRRMCPRCERPLSACICACAQTVDNRQPVLILQDPAERHEAKGTAKLLQLCLSRCTLLVGETFAPPPALQTEGEAASHWLLYPGEGARRADAVLAKGASTDGAQRPPTLVVLDGTWRASRRMLRNSPWLQSLPRLALPAPPASMYTIRKAHAPHQLSTLEATAWALRSLDPNGAHIQAQLAQAMHAFVARQRSLRPAGADEPEKK